MPRVDFWLKGQPVPKGRPRFNTRTGRAYTPAKTKEFEHRIAAAASDAMQDLNLEPATTKCTVHILAQFSIPVSWPKSRREAAQRGEIIPSRVDVDNLAKSVLDGCIGVTFEDDGQVEKLVITKKYGDPLVLASVEWDE